MILKNLAVVKILFDGDLIPPKRIQLAHSQIVGDKHRQHEEEYPLDQSKLDGDMRYFIVAFESAIPKLASIIGKQETSSFYHENENYTLRHVGLEYFDPARSQLGVTDQLYFYKIQNWCPFDQDEHRYFRDVLHGENFNWSNSFFEQRQYVQGFLRPHLFALLSAFHIPVSIYDIVCGFRLLKRSTNHTINHFNEKTRKIEAFPMWSFTGEFGCNLLIPEYTGIGRAARYGNGVVKKIDY